MASNNPYRYAGYRYDEATGLYYLMARYYDASVGRFLTRDTVQDNNLYAYSGNNPMNFTDPSGRLQKDDVYLNLDDLSKVHALTYIYNIAAGQNDKLLMDAAHKQAVNIRKQKQYDKFALGSTNIGSKYKDNYKYYYSASIISQKVKFTFRWLTEWDVNVVTGANWDGLSNSNAISNGVMTLLGFTMTIGGNKQFFPQAREGDLYVLVERWSTVVPLKVNSIRLYFHRGSKTPYGRL